jgi:hypothetical protein
MAEAIFRSMRKSHPIKLLLQVLLLAAVSLAMSVGSAFAHGGGAANRDQAQVHTAATHAEHQPDFAGDAASCEAFVQADRDDLSSGTCRSDPSGHAMGEGCCTVACHAALAVPGIGPLAAFDVPRAPMVALEDMLEGRSSDRTERPPKLS